VALERYQMQLECLSGCFGQPAQEGETRIAAASLDLRDGRLADTGAKRQGSLGEPLRRPQVLEERTCQPSTFHDAMIRYSVSEENLVEENKPPTGQLLSL
jgi:hypothetical protein